jgi:predicted RNA-binding Zn ribbon-like protein
MEAQAKGSGWTFELLGGRLCLDFVNTVSGKRVVNARDRLGGYPDLVSWALQAGAVRPPHARRLLAEARRRPADAERAFADAIALREAMHGVFYERAEGREPPRADLERVEGALRRALAHRRLVRGEGGFSLGWDETGELDAPTWPVAASAAELLTEAGALERVRICGLCEADECGWLFLDETRAGTRRWCSMKDCGNRAKARRFAERARKAAAPPGGDRKPSP